MNSTEKRIDKLKQEKKKVDVITTISMMKSDDSKEQNVVPIKEEVKAQ